MPPLMSVIAYGHLLPVIIWTEQQTKQGAASELLHLSLSCKKISCVEQIENTNFQEFKGRKRKSLTTQNQVHWAIPFLNL